MLHLREYQVSQWLHDSQSTALDLYSLHPEGQTANTRRIMQHSNANVTTRIAETTTDTQHDEYKFIGGSDNEQND